MPEVIIEEESKIFEQKKPQQNKKLKNIKDKLPGNNEIPYNDDLKHGVR